MRALQGLLHVPRGLGQEQGDQQKGTEGRALLMTSVPPGLARGQRGWGGEVALGRPSRGGGQQGPPLGALPPPSLPFSAPLPLLPDEGDMRKVQKEDDHEAVLAASRAGILLHPLAHPRAAPRPRSRASSALAPNADSGHCRVINERH